jgi:membrane fusion protein (multidrug efflux system)
MWRYPRLLLLLALIFWGMAWAEFGIDELEMRAQLSPRRFTTLSAELAARINRIHVREGEAFVAGQNLVEFDCTLQQAQLDKAKAQLYGAENVYVGNQRMAELNAIGQVELRNAEAEVLKAKADVTYLQASLDKCRIRAPYAGRAGEQKAREQQYVQAGQPLLEILDDAVLELEFIVPTRWLGWLKPGHRFKVRIDETGGSYPVKLLRIAPRADPVSQSVKAIAVLDGHFPELIAGMSGHILLSPVTPSID